MKLIEKKRTGKSSPKPKKASEKRTRTALLRRTRGLDLVGDIVGLKPGTSKTIFER